MDTTCPIGMRCPRPFLAFGRRGTTFSLLAPLWLGVGLLPGACLQPSAGQQAAPTTQAESRAPVEEIAKTSTVSGEWTLREWRGGVMGTHFQLEAIGREVAELDAVLGLALAELRRIEDVFTVWRESELTRLNARAGQGPIAVSPEVAQVIQIALDCAKLTDGAFDITYYPLRPLWDYKAEQPKLPSQAQIDAALALVDYRRIQVDLEQSTVEMPAGYCIDLGGIAKGYGVDRAMQVLLANGIKNGLVQAGGDTKALGRKFDRPWEIAIKNPRRQAEVFAVLPVVNQCVQTSGDYERFAEIDGQRYHHIIDPRTGWPSRGCMSATVIGPEATFADGLATALCVLGPERGLQIIEQLDRIEAVLVGLDGEVHLSSGLKKSGLPTQVR
jgi:FAD:protein FMN transferase